MAQPTIKCLVVILSLHSFSYLAEAIAHRPFDTFRLVLTWPPAFCARFDCLYTPIPNKFIIHGLWPENNTGDHLLNCETVRYTRIEDDDLLEKMTNNWIGLGRIVATWWRYQWETHGTCSLLFYTQMPYFALALKLREENDIYGFLADDDIVPSNEYLYEVAGIIDTIKARTGKDPHLYCERFPPNEEIQMLVEITLCFKPDGVMTDCVPGRWDGGCTNTHVYYKPSQ